MLHGRCTCFIFRAVVHQNLQMSDYDQQLISVSEWERVKEDIGGQRGEEGCRQTDRGGVEGRLCYGSGGGYR